MLFMISCQINTKLFVQKYEYFKIEAFNKQFIAVDFFKKSNRVHDKYDEI